MPRGRLTQPGRGRANDSPHYSRWKDMKKRCYNPNCRVYKHYGGRGIQVYKNWRENFWEFHDYLEGLEGYEDGLTMDRINNDGDYTPGNIRWAPKGTQMRNRRNWNGRQRGYYKTPYNSFQVLFKVHGKNEYFGSYKSESEAKKVAAFAERLIKNSLDG